MNTRKNKIFPIIITLIIISIVTYLFMNIKQPYIECSKTTTYDKNVKIIEKVKTTLDSNKISELKVVKKIVLPDELTDDKHIKSIKLALKDAYQYLGKKAKISEEGNSIIVSIDINKNETVILSDISVVYNDDVELKIASNTKSSDVISLKIDDNYKEGDLITRFRNYGYSCK
ncbi:MAG: hypothetical protein IJF92_05755 [Bacilli bacterium]|nr:hypothetical protein [Bacilli bacterium]